MITITQRINILFASKIDLGDAKRVIAINEMLDHDGGEDVRINRQPILQPHDVQRTVSEGHTRQLEVIHGVHTQHFLLRW